jgi:NADPH:quinone reductase-like Zn-dependent oxidoreductase
MKALVLTRYGGPDVLHVADRPDPVAQDRQVLVRLSHSAVNPIDTGVRAGRVRLDEAGRFPMTLGWNGAGVVEALGSAVLPLAEGARAHAMLDRPVLTRKIVLDHSGVQP